MLIGLWGSARDPGLPHVYGRNRLFLALTLRRIRQAHGMV
ncbi:MAG: hypothetical protein JWR58_132 [Pseudonocardia sp.]|jgi:hypothetical protein|nr:hypothetical protein [Pseudonocardia sp.]